MGWPLGAVTRVMNGPKLPHAAASDARANATTTAMLKCMTAVDESKKRE